MRSRPEDDFSDGDGEGDDFSDHDRLDWELDSVLDTAELPGDFVHYLAEQWRADEENKAINVHLPLDTALSQCPNAWIDAACRANRVLLRGRTRHDRRAKIAALVASLTDQAALTRSIIELPLHARAALRRILERGGWARLSELTRLFGGMKGDGWFWDEQPPRSSLGELRRRGLLYVGKTSLTRSGEASKRLFKVAVIPQELRQLLQSIIDNSAVRLEEESAIAAKFATPNDLLNDAIECARNHFASLDWHPPIRLTDVELFLTGMCEQGYNPLLAWYAVDILINFIEHHLHEIQAPENLCAYHVSELASSFVDLQYMQRWSLDERRNLIEVVRHLYRHLHADGRVPQESLEEIEDACTRLNNSKRKLNAIHRPPPLGGELIFTRINPNTGDEERYTFNHQRLLMVWAGAFHQDWKTMLSVCATVPTGQGKAALIHELIALDPGICDLIISQADEDDFDRAIQWFYEERMLELSAW